MDLMVTSSINVSTLLHTSKSFDYALRLAENKKFDKDLRNPEPLKRFATRRFIPLVLNQCGKRGPHFEATLREFASLLIRRSSGCSLLQGPFAIPPKVALTRILNCWGARLSWTVQVELSAHVIRGVEAHKTAASFMLFVAIRGDNLHVRVGGQRGSRPNCRTGDSLVYGSLVGGVNWVGMAGARAGGGDVQGYAV